MPLSARATEIGVFGPNRHIEATTTFVANLPALAVAMSVCVTYIGTYIGGGPRGNLTATGGREPPDAGTAIRDGSGFPSTSGKEARLPALVPGAMPGDTPHPSRVPGVRVLGMIVAAHSTARRRKAGVAISV